MLSERSVHVRAAEVTEALAWRAFGHFIGHWVLRGWGNYFKTGNAARKFNQLDSYVWQRLRALVRKRKGRNLRPGEMARWTRDEFVRLGLHRLRGTVRYPGDRTMPLPDRPPVSRVREIRTHGLNGGLATARPKGGGK